jgi:dTDP-4-amino-4,6-dideoxygalactose transaminase
MTAISQAASPRIGFNQPELTGKELEYIKQALENVHISGDGPFTKRCQALLEEELGVPRVFLTTSCTHALELAALLMDLQPEDEVIVPSFTFVSTVNAFVLRGIRPVFIDIRPDTLDLNEDLLEGLITPRTRVILPVHYAGVACEMDAILKITGNQDHPIHVIEDNAHGLFGRYKGKFLGTFGTLSSLSFHETKNITCGEGGALLINDPQFVERAEILREKGTNRSRFFRGQVDKYTWIDVGSSYLPSDILAAFLYAQLEVRTQIQAKRRHVWEYYDTHLKGWAEDNGIQLPCIPPYCDQPYHMFFMVMPSLEARQSLIDRLRVLGIQSVFHYLPLHLSRMGLSFGGRPGDCPVTERVSDCLIRLPFYNNLTESDQGQVVEAIREFKF